MDTLKRRAIILDLIEKMENRGSGCGETHVQKAVYFLEAVGCVPLSFDFILYKQSPFSFDLSDELMAMRADDLLDLRIKDSLLGPRLVATRHAESVKMTFPKTLSRHRPAIQFVVKQFAENDLARLGSLSTALYLAKSHVHQGPSRELWTSVVKKLTPQIGADEAKAAVDSVQKMLEKSKRFCGTVRVKNGRATNGGHAATRTA